MNTNKIAPALILASSLLMITSVVVQKNQDNRIKLETANDKFISDLLGDTSASSQKNMDLILSSDKITQEEKNMAVQQVLLSEYFLKRSRQENIILFSSSIIALASIYTFMKNN